VRPGQEASDWTRSPPGASHSGIFQKPEGKRSGGQGEYNFNPQPAGPGGGKEERTAARVRLHPASNSGM